MTIAIIIAVLIVLGLLLRARARHVAEVNEIQAEDARLYHEESRRAHLYQLANTAAITGQEGPTYSGGGTVGATQEEMDRVLGAGWLEAAKDRHTNPATRSIAGTASVWAVPHA